MMSLRYYLITGANRGIGLEFARQLLQRGDGVVACSRQPNKSGELEKLSSMYSKDDQLVSMALDVTIEKEILSLPAQVEKAGIRLHALILNAGVAEPSETIGTIKEADILRVIHTNAVAPILITQAFSMPPFHHHNRYLPC